MRFRTEGMGFGQGWLTYILLAFQWSACVNHTASFKLLPALIIHTLINTHPVILLLMMHTIIVCYKTAPRSDTSSLVCALYFFDLHLRQLSYVTRVMLCSGIPALLQMFRDKTASLPTPFLSLPPFPPCSSSPHFTLPFSFLCFPFLFSVLLFMSFIHTVGPESLRALWDCRPLSRQNILGFKK